MKVRLVFQQGGRRKVVSITQPTAVLGRSHGNAVRIPSPEVSRKHCRLLLSGGLVMIEDLDSVNGTFLNGERLAAVEVVRPGDQIEVGPVTFTVEYELTSDALRRLHGRGGDKVQEVEEVVDVLEAMEEEEVEMAEFEEVEDAVFEVDDEVEAVTAEGGDLIPTDFDLDVPWGKKGRDDDEPPTSRHKPKR